MRTECHAENYGSSTTYNADNAQTKFNGTSLSDDTDGNLTGDGTNTYYLVV